MINLKNIGKIVKMLRLHNHQSLSEVAVQLGISKATLWRVEQGAEMDIKTLKALCSYWGIEPNEVLGFKKGISQPHPGIEFVIQFLKDTGVI